MKNKESKLYDYDPVLLKIHRMYGKDEAISYLYKEISTLNQTVGELKSEVAELEYKLAQYQFDVTNTKEFKKDAIVANLQTQVGKLNREKMDLKKELTYWMTKNISKSLEVVE